MLEDKNSLAYFVETDESVLASSSG